MTTLRVTDETSRADIEEALLYVNESLHRMPAHWTDRRAVLHAKIDALLDDWEVAT